MRWYKYTHNYITGPKGERSGQHYLQYLVDKTKNSGSEKILETTNLTVHYQSTSTEGMTF